MAVVDLLVKQYVSRWLGEGTVVVAVNTIHTGALCPGPTLLLPPTSLGPRLSHGISDPVGAGGP